MSKHKPFVVLLAAAGFVATMSLAQAADGPNSYVQINLVGSAPGSAKTIDSELVDAWGVANAPTGRSGSMRPVPAFRHYMMAGVTRYR